MKENFIEQLMCTHYWECGFPYEKYSQCTCIKCGTQLLCLNNMYFPGERESMSYNPYDVLCMPLWALDKDVGIV